MLFGGICHTHGASWNNKMCHMSYVGPWHDILCRRQLTFITRRNKMSFCNSMIWGEGTFLNCDTKINEHHHSIWQKWGTRYWQKQPQKQAANSQTGSFITRLLSRPLCHLKCGVTSNIAMIDIKCCCVLSTVYMDRQSVHLENSACSRCLDKVD